ncbi:MAG: LysR family transcriptional regulator [Neomegalonema sp.]|nr:LysR family transcriptional regulator [Neomegalonema sp.]
MNDAPPSWDLCRSFLAVLREGSLSAAARRLQLTQPTVARHINMLEQALGGGSLFTRSPQGLAPTERAARLRSYAEAMEAAASAMARSAANDEKALSGVVRIAASDVIGAEVLPAILATLRQDYPQLHFEIALSNASANLLSREADIAVRMVRPRQQALLAKPVGEIVLGLHAHPEYLARFGAPQSLDELRNHAMIGVDKDHNAALLISNAPLPLKDLNFAYRCDNQIAHLSMLRAACGIGLCQVGLAKRTPQLVRLFADQVAIPMETWITMHEDLRRDRRMRLVFDRLHDAIAAYAAEG